MDYVSHVPQIQINPSEWPLVVATHYPEAKEHRIIYLFAKQDKDRYMYLSTNGLTMWLYEEYVTVLFNANDF